MISQYWVGQIPNRPLSILVKDSEGSDMDLSIYTTINIKMLGTFNEEINVSSGTLNTNNAINGKIIYNWPTGASLFEYPGDYIVQLELSGTGKKDFTSSHTIRVRELGRRYK
jgi:hypothetical protein